MVAMRTLARRGRKFQYSILGAAAVLAASQFAQADNFTWTGTTNNSWNLTDANWDNTTLATLGVPWTNNVVITTPNTATFSLVTPPVAITVDAPIFVGGITFTTSGWDIAAGTGSLSFGDVGTIVINNPGINAI